MTPEEQAEKNLDLAMARLGVAEDLSWWIGILTGYLIHLKWASLALSVAAGAVLWFLVRYPYNRNYEAASEAYERVTRTGRYYSPNLD